MKTKLKSQNTNVGDTTRCLRTPCTDTSSFKPHTSSTVLQTDRTGKRPSQQVDSKSSPGFRTKTNSKPEHCLTTKDTHGTGLITNDSFNNSYHGNNAVANESGTWNPPPCGDSFFDDSQEIPSTLVTFKSRSTKNSPNTAGLSVQNERKTSLETKPKFLSSVMSDEISITENECDSFDNYMANNERRNAFRLSPPKLQKNVTAANNGSHHRGSGDHSNMEYLIDDSCLLDLTGDDRSFQNKTNRSLLSVNSTFGKLNRASL